MAINMSSKESLQKIKSDVNEYVGQKVCVKCNIGRNKCEYREGIIADTYASTFNIIDTNTSHNLSYGYTDLLTNNLELTLPSGESIVAEDYTISTGYKF